jgi:predicted nucleic acid-binding protein
MTRLVLDASVMIKLFIDQPGSERVAERVAQAGELLAPDLLWTEVGNVLWKYVRSGDLEATQARELLTEMMLMPVRVTSAGELAGDALEIATRCGCTVYDGMYLALAVRQRAVVLTADERLVRKLADDRLGPYVHGLMD